MSSPVTTAIAESIDRKGFAITPQFLEPRLVRELRDEALALRREGSFRQAGVGRGGSWRVDPEVRSDFVHWLDQSDLSSLQETVMRRYEQLRMEINQRLLLGLFSWEGHLTVYPAGAHYARHLDRFRDAMHRTVSTTLYLNDTWSEEDGGQLRLYLDSDLGEFIDVLPQGGTLVTFVSDRFEHEVIAARRERVSLTGWFARRV